MLSELSGGCFTFSHDVTNRVKRLKSFKCCNSSERRLVLTSFDWIKDSNAMGSVLQERSIASKEYKNAVHTTAARYGQNYGNGGLN